MAGGTQGEIAGVLIGGTELDSVAVGGFEMSGGHLVGVERHALPAGFHPVSHSLVKICAVRLQQPAVRDVADQHVVEAPDWLVADIRAARLGEFEPAKSIEGRLDFRRRGAGERPRGAEREVGADHRSDLEDASIGGVEPFQPRGEERVDRRRDGDGVDVDREPPADRLLDEYPVVRWEAPQEFVRQPGGAEHIGREFGCRTGVEAIEVDRRGHPPTGVDEVGPDLAQLGPGKGKHENRHLLHPLEEVLDEVEQQRVGPLDVVEDEQNRPAQCEHLDEPAQRPESLLDRAGDAGRQPVEVAQQAIALGNARGNLGFEVASP
jgi:hypothetical protein